MVEEGGLDFSHNDRRGIRNPGSVFIVETDDLVLTVLDDTIETSQDGERKNDVTVLMGFE